MIPLRVIAEVDGHGPEGLRGGAWTELGGMTLAERILIQISRAGMVDEVRVLGVGDKETDRWTGIGQNVGCNVTRPRNGNVSDPGDEGPAVRFRIQAWYPLLSVAALQGMFSMLMEDDGVRSIAAITRVEPRIMIRASEDRLIPMWHVNGMDRQKYPDLWRRLEIGFEHHGRIRHPGFHRHKEKGFEVGLWEGMELCDEPGLGRMEFYLSRHEGNGGWRS